MELYKYLIVILIICSIVAIIDCFWPIKSPDTFPDDKFLSTWKRYNTKEVAEALDEICKDI